MVLDQIVYAAVIGCILFLAVLVSFKKTNTPIGYWFFSLLFVIIALVFSDYLLDHFNVYKKYPALIVVFQPSLYAISPLIYLSVCYLTTVEKKLSAKLVLHFIPYLLVLSLYSMPYVFSNPKQTTGPDDADDKVVELLLLFLFFIQIFLYLYFSVRQLKRHRLTLPLFVSSISDNDYHWLFKAIIGLSVLLIISLIEVVFDHMHIPFYFSFLYLIGFYYIGIQVVKQKDVFPFSKEQIESVNDLIKDQQPAYDTNNKDGREEFQADNVKKNLPERKKLISEESTIYYSERLKELMELKKPYLDNELTLPRLAELLQLNTYQTSYLINASFDENFYSFINRYRIENCKQMLVDPLYSHLSILGIAFESGFNSKTAFNTVFKKSTGLSPKGFREQINTKK